MGWRSSCPIVRVRSGSTAAAILLESTPPTDAIFTRTWLRIYLFSENKGLDITRWYVSVVRVSQILLPHRQNVPIPGARIFSTRLSRHRRSWKMAWVFRGGIFIYGIRKRSSSMKRPFSKTRNR